MVGAGRRRRRANRCGSRSCADRSHSTGSFSWARLPAQSCRVDRPVGRGASSSDPAPPRPGRDRARPGRQLLLVRSDDADVARFFALAALTDVELDGLALDERLPADALHVRDVHEHVIAALACDESEPSVLVEKLHFALHTHQLAFRRTTEMTDRVTRLRARGVNCAFGRTRCHFPRPR
jgi:hypothetical protein